MQVIEQQRQRWLISSLNMNNIDHPWPWDWLCMKGSSVYLSCFQALLMTPTALEMPHTVSHMHSHRQYRRYETLICMQMRSVDLQCGNNNLWWNECWLLATNRTIPLLKQPCIFLVVYRKISSISTHDMLTWAEFQDPGSSTQASLKYLRDSYSHTSHLLAALCGFHYFPGWSWPSLMIPATCFLPLQCAFSYHIAPP